MCGNYKAIDELLKQKIGWVTQDSKNFYVKLADEYDSQAVWQVNKKTKKVTYEIYPPVELLINGNETDISPTTFKRAMQ